MIETWNFLVRMWETPLQDAPLGWVMVMLILVLRIGGYDGPEK